MEYRLLVGRLPRRGNVLSFSLAGDGEIDLLLVAKKPGPALDLDVARAAIPLASLHGADPLPPYARLIHDVLLGDPHPIACDQRRAGTSATIVNSAS